MKASSDFLAGEKFDGFPVLVKIPSEYCDHRHIDAAEVDNRFRFP